MKVSQPHALPGQRIEIRCLEHGIAVDRKIAVSRWVASRQPLPQQVVIYNPFSLSLFKQRPAEAPSPPYDFVFIGRLVSEKGDR